MESLSNFNFLTAMDVKKSSDGKSDEKSLLDNDKSFVIDKVDNIENKLNNSLIDKEFSEEFISIEKEKTNGSKKSINVENPEVLAVDTYLIKSENETNIDLDYISSQKQKEKNNVFNQAKNSLLNTIPDNEKEITSPNNIEKISNKKIISNNLENNILNKPQFVLTNTKTIKHNSEIQSISNKSKKSKIKSFFQNYFNYTFKKYSKKNISMKKYREENLTNYDRKNYNKEIPLLSNKNIGLNDKNNGVINDQKTNINFENNSREHTNISDNNIKSNIEKNDSNTKETTFDNFDRLKNILDIRSNDFKQRFSQILENNIRMNKNKFEIQLRPENLGKIKITLEITGQNVDININSDNISAIQSLTENNSNLQKMLQNHGMNLNNFNFNGNNNKGSNKDSKKSESLKNENVSVNTNKNNNNDDDSFVSNSIC